jgi:phosphate-selective porin OprO/OprP
MRAKLASLLVLLIVPMGTGAHGGTTSGHEAGKPGKPAEQEVFAGLLNVKSASERIKSGLGLYQNEENPWVRSVSLMTQLQMQYAHGSANTGNFGTADWPDNLSWGETEVRRFRFGLRAKLVGDLSFFSLSDFHPDFSDGVYKRLPEAYFTWTHSDALAVSAGKTELKFDREQEYSSAQFPVFERTAVGNMLYGGELTGIWVCGKNIGTGWLYSVGVYSNERQDEWPESGGTGAITVSKIGYDYTGNTSFDFAQVKLEWLHNTKPGYRNSSSNPASPLYSNSFSLSNEFKLDRLGVAAEILRAEGSGNRSDVTAFSTMTRWSFTEKLEFINVMEIAGSPGSDGIFIPARYEALSPGLTSNTGDQWFSGYAGLNYYMDGHSVKLMSGVKYSHMSGTPTGDSFDGWTWLCGVRMFF